MIPRRFPTTQWLLREIDHNVHKMMVREMGIHPIISILLQNRDIIDPDAVQRYLCPTLKDLHNPFLMQDMKTAVDRLVYAIERKEKIGIYGDYDVDGITSVTLLVHFLRQLHADPTYYIPDRLAEGYGLNLKALERLRAKGVNLLITVDCGISDHEAIIYAKELGIETIVLDHHEISEILPSAAAVVNPHRKDCQFPFKQLAAVGIVFNFLIALRGTLRRGGFWKTDYEIPNLKNYLDLVALGTIGDIVPLVDENRIFAKYGLEVLTEERRVGIASLKWIAGIERQTIDSIKASYNLIPRLNAAGRVASASEAVELLLSENRAHADGLSKRLDAFNRKRQTLEKQILIELTEKILAKDSLEKGAAMVYASPDWHPGVIGIVASKLVDRFRRPTILISLKDGIGKGSGRSIDNINIYQDLKSCDSLLLSYGGHRYAAGISIREDDIEPFRKQLDEVVRGKLVTDTFTVKTLIDIECKLADIDQKLLQELDRMAPFGSQNPEPVFCVSNVSVASPAIVGNNHLRMRVSDNVVSRNAIWFSKGQFLSNLSSTMLDIVFTPQINHWNGTADIQLKMRDVALQETV